MSKELDDLRAAVANADDARIRHRKQSELVVRLGERLELYRERLSKERADVEDLEGPGIVAFVRGLFTDRDAELDRERRELATAVLLHDEARAELAEAREKLVEIAAAVDAAPETRARLERRLRELAAAPGGLAPEDELELRRIDLRKARREVVEAERAAVAALDSIETLSAALISARSIGYFDLLGGGTIVSMLKHGQIGSARSRLATAQLRLRELAREVEDLRDTSITSLEIGSLATFADVFFDNLFSDWIVQSRLDGSLEQVRATRVKVRELHAGLREKLHALDREIAAAG